MPPSIRSSAVATAALPVRVVAPVALAAAVACGLLGAPRPLGAAAVALLAGACGHALVAGVVPRRDPLATFALGLASGLAGLALGALVLADLGVFGPVAATVLAGGAVVAASVLPGRARGGVARPGGGPAALPVAALAALLLAGGGAAVIPAYAFDLGGRDAGLYVMASEHLRRTGELGVDRPPVVRDGLARFGGTWLGTSDPAVPYPGVYRDGARDVPHGYHATPAAMAAGALVTGGGGQWFVTLGGIALVLLAAAIAGLLARPPDRAAARLVAGVLLAVNAALVYFSRYPMTEVPSGVVLLGSAAATLAAARGGGTRAAVLAGALLGLAPLVRADAWPLLVVAPVAAWVLLHRGGPRAAVAYAAGLVPLALYATVRALTTTSGYTDDAIGQVLRWADGTTVVAVVAALAVGATVLLAAAAARGPRGRAVSVVLERSMRISALLSTPRVRIAAAAIVVVGTLVLVAAPPTTGLRIFRTYATPPGLLLAGAALALAAWRPDALDLRGATPLLVMGAVALALVSGRPQVLVADQYWTARRYLPVALPLTAVLAGLAVARAVGLAWALRAAGGARDAAGRAARARRLAAPAALVAVALALGGAALALRDARPAITTTEFDGVPQQISRLDRMLAGRDALILGGPNIVAYAQLVPSLALREGREAVALRPARAPTGDLVARLDDQRFAAWVRDQIRVRPVYLLLADAGELNVARDPSIALDRVGTFTLAVRQTERRVGGPPRGATTARTPVIVSRLRLAAPAR